MRAGLLALVLLGMLAANSSTLAQVSTFASVQNTETPASVRKRQIAGCMSRRMAADRMLTFNAAAKACKEQLKSAKSDTAANGAPKPVG